MKHAIVFVGEKANKTNVIDKDLEILFTEEGMAIDGMHGIKKEDIAEIYVGYEKFIFPKTSSERELIIEKITKIALESERINIIIVGRKSPYDILILNADTGKKG